MTQKHHQEDRTDEADDLANQIGADMEYDELIKKAKIVVGRCVHNGEPIVCTGLCNTQSCPFPLWMAMGLPFDPKQATA